MLQETSHIQQKDRDNRERITPASRTPNNNHYESLRRDQTTRRTNRCGAQADNKRECSHIHNEDYEGNQTT